ncbi:MAG: DUF1116 domain-containing protein [Solobacterium sp.]|nr:DUF1116 domain-containing protein [Solobacterium sp.]
MKINELFAEELSVVNIGSPTFLKDLDSQAVSYENLEWTPPAHGDVELIRVLDKLEKHKEEIDEANDRVVARVKAATGYLVDCKKAIDAIPGMKPNMILHSGPVQDWEHMADPQKGAVLGAIVFEGWAENVEEAEKYLLSHDIEFSPNHHVNCVGPMAGVVSPSMPVHVLHDEVNDTYAFCPLNEGLGGVLRFGKNTPDVIERLLWMKNDFMPVLAAALKICGGIDVRNIIMQALNMGDECHNRNKAATSLFFREIAVPIMKTDFPMEQKQKALDFITGNEHYFLNLSMPYCKLAQLAGTGEKKSSIVTIMCRNGYEFGIKVSGSDTWHTAPANMVKGLYFPGYSEEDAAPDLGDSCITETNGIGGFAMAASPAIVKFVGGTVQDAFNYSQSMNEITWSSNPNFTLPALDFKPSALGIDIRKVVESGVLPIINTGIAHKKAGIGQIGAGLVNPPFECFKKAIIEFAEQFED